MALTAQKINYAIAAAGMVVLAAVALGFHFGHFPGFFAASTALALFLVASSIAVITLHTSRWHLYGLVISITAALGVAIAWMSAEELQFGLPSDIAAPLVKAWPRTSTSPGSIYGRERTAKASVFKHSVPADHELFLDGFDKRQLKSFSDLARSAGQYHARWRATLIKQGFTEAQSKAVSSMLFASTLWGYGNERSPDKVGCISRNEENAWKYEEPTIDVVRRAAIGCCTDYAFALGIILASHGFESRYVTIPGHVFNEAKIDGRWYVLDANTTVFMESAWNDLSSSGSVRIHVFPHPGSQAGKLRREIIAPFQNYVINMAAFGLAPAGAIQVGGGPPYHKRKSLYEPLIDVASRPN